MQIIHGGLDTWDALTYGEQNPNNINYFRKEVQNFGNTLTNIGQSFFSNAQELFDRFNGSRAIQLLRQATKATQSLFQPNIVKPLSTIDEMQNATLIMQRWIMANPVVRQSYHEQKCDGYSDTYLDAHPGDIRETHYDYRRVMDGMVIVNEETDEWKVKFYPDDIYENDRELIHGEKVDILHSWDIIEMFMKAGDKDPTSQYGTSL